MIRKDGKLPLVTLKKYLFDGEIDLRRVMSFIFKGISANAVRADEEEYGRLSAELERVDASIGEEFTTEKLLAAAGAAIRAIENYNQRTTRLIGRQSLELQKIITMLAESVISIGGSSERSTNALGAIRANLEHARGLEDLQNVKASLGVCLEQVCAESANRREEAKRAIAELQEHIRRAEGHLMCDANIDPVTGLGGRAAAEAALREAVSTPGRKYIGVLVLDRLQSINSRFGSSVGDRVFAELARHLERELTQGDVLFRLSGPTLLALMHRQCSIDRMRIDLKPLFSKPLEKEFDVGGRTVLIPVSPAWTVVGLVPPLTTILKHIDTFVASQIPKDFI